MPDDNKPKPLDDVRKGLGLLFRAAKNTVEKLPTRDLEQVMVTSAREVGRAIENVGKTLEREVFGGKDKGDRDKKDGPPGPDETKAHVKDEKEDTGEGTKPPAA